MTHLAFTLVLICSFPSGKVIESTLGQYQSVEACKEELDFLASKRQGYKPPTHVVSYTCRAKKA
jgi:hypothetical protein